MIDRNLFTDDAEKCLYFDVKERDSTGSDDFGRATACFGGGEVATNIRDGDDKTYVRIECTLRVVVFLLRVRWVRRKVCKLLDLGFVSY